jgi:hypothetical protein
MGKWLLLFIGVSLFVGCVPKDIAKAVCPKIAGFNTITVKITSSEPFPENLGVSLNSGDLAVYESCSSNTNSVLMMDESRTTARAVIYLESNDDTYFPNAARAPQDDYANVTLVEKKNCASQSEEFHFKENVAITWLKASKISPACTTDYFHGVSEFSYSP